MADEVQGAQGGTVDTAGSQAPEAVAGQSTGAEGAGAASEPMVKIGDSEVPLSVAQRALKNDSRFTETSQELAERARKVAEQEANIQQEKLTLSSLDGIAKALQNPDVLERVAQVAPEVVQAMPTTRQQVDTTLLAENLQLRFNNYAATADLTPEEAAGVRAEMFRLASSGNLEAAMDFDNIGLRLYKDAIIDRRASALAAKSAAEAAQRSAAETVMPGAAPIPTPQSMSGVRGESLISQAHQQNAQNRKR